MNNIKKLFSTITFATILGINPIASFGAEIDVIPMPVKVNQLHGEFTLPSQVSISYNTKEGKAIADYLASKIKTSTGYTVNVGTKKSQVAITINPSMKINEEGYRLNVSAKGVTIKAKTAKGAFYGMQTLLQLYLPR